jgi:hypothetical protein
MAPREQTPFCFIKTGGAPENRIPSLQRSQISLYATNRSANLRAADHLRPRRVCWMRSTFRRRNAVIIVTDWFKICNR